MGFLTRREACLEGPRHSPRGDGRSRLVSVLSVAALLVLGGFERTRGQDPAASPVAEGDPQSLSAHYRFQERYSDDPAKPNMLNEYRVGIRERVRITSDRAEGAPEVSQLDAQSIFTERVAQMSREGQVIATVRSYTAASQKSTIAQRPLKTPLLKGMEIFYKLQQSVAPQVLSLNGRQIRQPEYQAIVQQSFLPALVTILPRQPARVGDTWAIPRIAGWALLGSQPSEEDFDLTGEVLSVRKNPPDNKNLPENSMTAVIGIKGSCLVEQGPSGINGAIQFTFKPTPTESGAGARGRPLVPAGGDAVTGKTGTDKAAGHFDASGYISRISLAQEITRPQTEGDGRLKEVVRRELLLERRLPAPGTPPSLDVPKTVPTPTTENSWLVYDDPEGRFHLLHPQEMMIARQYPDGGIDLLDRRPDGHDVIMVNLLARTGDAQRDRLAADPGQEKKRLEDEWKRNGEKVLPSHTDGWLEGPEWKKVKGRVYRIEAALLAKEDEKAPASGRIYLDQYIVQLNRGETLKVRAMTTRDPHLPLREIAESLIQSFELGASDGSAPATAPGHSGSTATPAPAR